MGGVVLDLYKINWLLAIEYETLKIQRNELDEILNEKKYSGNEKKILENILKNYKEIIDFIDETSTKNLSKDNLEYKRIGFVTRSILQPIYMLRNNKSSNSEELLYDIFDKTLKIKSYIIGCFFNSDVADERNKIIQIVSDLKVKVEEVDSIVTTNKLLSDDLRNKTINQIYTKDSSKFKKIAIIYEAAFYILLFLMAFYFFGYHFEINTSFLSFKIGEHISSLNKPEFYIQKISLIILTSSLAAFFLKRSFMSRRLADEAYRTAHEIDGLPRYMIGLPNELKEKIRFDLAYKYFGNGIHHESYTGSENLMHENIKANTEFFKVVKDLTPKVEAAKEEKAAKDAV